jgi:hypothetical protein
MILSDVMEGKGPGFVTPAQVGKEVAQREGHRSLYPNQTPLKQLGQHGLSLSGDAAISPSGDTRGVGLHMAPGVSANLTAIGRALQAPLTSLRARGMGSKTFHQDAKEREATLKEAAGKAAVPLAAAESSSRAFDDAEKERKYQEWKRRQRKQE